MTLLELSQGVSKSAISKWKHHLEANGAGLFDAQHRFMDDKERIENIFVPWTPLKTCDFIFLVGFMVG